LKWQKLEKDFAMKRFGLLSLLLSLGQVYANQVTVVLTNNSDIDYVIDTQLPRDNPSRTKMAVRVPKGHVEVTSYKNITRVFWGPKWGNSHDLFILPSPTHFGYANLPADQNVTVVINCAIEHPRCVYKIVTPNEQQE
jgi:hypothetical protein